MREIEEDKLIQAALGGDVDSFSQLCNRHYSTLVAVAYAHLTDRHLAEDVAQESLLVAFRDISKLKKAKHFSRWLVVICRNLAVDLAKKRGRQSNVAIDENVNYSDGDSKPDERVAAAKEIVSNLPGKMKEVIFLRYYKQMSYQEISRILGLSEQAVNGRLRRAKKKIKLQLQRRFLMEAE